MSRFSLLYAGIVVFFAFAVWFLAPATPAPAGAGEVAREHLEQQLHHPLSVLLLQIIVVLVAARAFGYLAKKTGQQPVIGEIMAGIFLGPSILGWAAPDFSQFVFPASSLPALSALSQMGLIFFMFIVGTEMDLGKLRNHGRDALLVSHGAIAFSFSLGMVLAYATHARLAPPGVPFLSYALFMGIALSITAFPVLARILRERGLAGTPLGSFVMVCAAIDDVTAWCLLAVVIAVVKAGGMAGAWLTIGLAATYMLLMLLGVRRWLNRWMVRLSDSRRVVGIAFSLLLISAYVAEVIGIHALFGAFVAGLIVSEQQELKEALRQKLEDISLLMLLPIFFAITGLRTHIGSIDQPALWALCAGVVAVAVLGKLGGGLLAARLTGRPWRECFTIGTLMNTRGLMELVILNIGYDLGVLSPQIFAILVVMALVTTGMTGPLLNWAERRRVSEPV